MNDALKITRFGSDPRIIYYDDTPTLDLLDTNNEKLQYLAQLDGTDFETTVANAIDTQFIIKNTIVAGGRVLLLMPDSEPQEFVFNNEE